MNVTPIAYFHHYTSNLYILLALASFLVHCMGYVYSEAVWSLYARELPAKYGYDDNTSLEIVTRLTYIAAGNIQTWFSGSPPFGGCGTNSGYFSFLAADDDNGNLNDGTPHMEAIYKVRLCSLASTLLSLVSHTNTRYYL